MRGPPGTFIAGFEMKNPLISVVTPVYNAEQYLENCVQSMLSQTIQNIEIILVDDGSLDKSGFLCDEFAQKDSRIKIIHQQNQGVTAARAAGIKKSSGEWICFVDSDDELPKNSLELLLNNAKDDIDIVVGSVQFQGHYKWPYKKMSCEISNIDFMKMLLKHRVPRGPWARLFRKKLFHGDSLNIPRKIVCAEDFIMNLRLAQCAKKIRIIPNTVYSYIERPNSAMSQNPFANKDYMLSFERILLESFSKENRERLKYAIFWNRFCRRYFRLKQLLKLEIGMFRA